MTTANRAWHVVLTVLSGASRLAWGARRLGVLPHPVEQGTLERRVALFLTGSPGLV